MMVRGAVFIDRGVSYNQLYNITGELDQAGEQEGGNDMYKKIYII
jgi:hypothetical protein